MIRLLLESTHPLAVIPCDHERIAADICQETEEWHTVLSLPDEAALVQLLTDLGDRCTLYLRAREPYWPPAIPSLCLHCHNEPDHRVRITVEDT